MYAWIFKILVAILDCPISCNENKLRDISVIKVLDLGYLLSKDFCTKIKNLKNARNWLFQWDYQKFVIHVLAYIGQCINVTMVSYGFTVSLLWRKTNH